MERVNKVKSENILYSFRRCPFAMRARLALVSAQVPVIIREVSLKNKPVELLTISKNATVPCLKTATKVIPESLDIMLWALSEHDPEHLLDIPEIGLDLIEYCDGPFKKSLDRRKYKSRYENVELELELRIAKDFLYRLDLLLTQQFLFGQKRSLVDLALLPFIRQYAFIDNSWFDNQEWYNLKRWLTSFLCSKNFEQIQQKFPIWQPGDKPCYFHISDIDS